MWNNSLSCGMQKGESRIQASTFYRNLQHSSYSMGVFCKPVFFEFYEQEVIA